MRSFEVLEGVFMRDSIMEALGFKMNNLKAFPFSRIPGTIQVELIEELDVQDTIKLVNVVSGFRRYFARNGIFGRHVHRIGICHFPKDAENEDEYFEIFIQKGF